MRRDATNGAAGWLVWKEDGHTSKRRGSFGHVGALILLFALLALPVTSATAAAKSGKFKPNIIVIMADDMGYGDASCYGNTEFETPHIDALATAGMKFTDFHVTGPVCSPTRAGLLTGRYQQRSGIDGVIYAGFHQNRHHGLFQKEITFAELLSQAGYTTAIFGKWHLGYEKRFNPTHNGFDRFRGYVSGNVDYISHFDRMGVKDWWDGLEVTDEPGYTTHLITEHAVRFIEENKDRSFCLYIPHEAPHSPYQGPGDPAIRVSGKVVAEKVDKSRKKRAYREMIQEMDKGVGQVVATVERLGLAQNTLILFFSDNGATTTGSNGPLHGFKGSVWEGGIREPAVAWWPGKIEAGSISGELIISLDILPTMLALAGVDPPLDHKLDGVNLLPLLLEGKSLGQRKLFWEYTGQQAMRDGQWKLVRNAKGQKGVGLYDLSKDLGELHNLADVQPQRVKRMLADFAAWKADVTSNSTIQPETPTGN